jgi:AcrR family transcriptional regulator
MAQKAPRRAAPSPTRRAVRRTKGKTGRTNNAEASRAEILSAATREFSEKGLSGARVDEIAERTKINKRMIYYYFESKEGLYRAVLERCYGHIRMSESAMDLDALSPEEALRQLVRHTFDYHNTHPDFVRLVMNENIHQGAYIADIASIKTRNRHVVATLRGLIDRGIAAGVFRADLEPIELHMSISALCFYNVSNRYTFSRIFERDMSSREAVKRRREVVVDMIVRWCANSATPKGQRSASSR